MSHAGQGGFRILPHRRSADTLEVQRRPSRGIPGRALWARWAIRRSDGAVSTLTAEGGTRGDLHFSPVDHRLIPGAPGGDRRPSERRRVSSRQKKIPGFRRWSCTAARTEDSPGARAGAGGGIRGPWAPDPSSRASPAIRRQAGAHGAGPARSLDRWGDAPREARGLV